MLLSKFKQLLSADWRSFVVKLFAYIALTYMSVILISIAIVAFLLLNVDMVKNKIINYVNQNTGLVLNIGNVQSKLDEFYTPEIIFHDISLSNSKETRNITHVKSLDLALSFDSFLKFQPIFSKIAVDGTQLNFIFESDNSLYLNGIKIIDPEADTLTNTKELPFDIEAWILRQKNINLKNIGISLKDNKNNLPNISLNKADFNLSRGLWNKHYADISLYGRNDGELLKSELYWNGGKFEKISDWKDVEFSTRAYSTKNGNIDDKLITVISVLVKDNKLQHIRANFNLDNFKAILSGIDVFNLPEFGGLLDVELVDNNKYILKSKDFRIASSSGILFDNAKINGEYLVGKDGFVEISNTNLLALNTVLDFFDSTHGMELSGMIESSRYDWTGKFNYPQTYMVSAKFNDISLISKESDIPSISHINGSVRFNQESGNVNILLKNSVLNYDSIFLIPYEFNYLSSSLNWNIDSKKIVRVNLENTSLQTKDFTGTASGKFVYDPNNIESPSYIDMVAHVDKVLTSKIGDYLPIQIPMSVHKWLNMALIDGYGESADMVLRGPLNTFPFADNSGLFYIVANINNAKLRYVESWPTLDNIYGKFILDNAAIKVKSNKALVSGNIIDKADVIIPDYTAESGVYLIANGVAHGETEKFMEYLRNSPINQWIGKFPEEVNTSGSGKLNIYLKVPFESPEHTEVKGDYQFINNSIDFINMPVPPILDVNGYLGFTQHGVNSEGISLRSLNSDIMLSAETNKKTKLISFNVMAPNLDYNAVSIYYLPMFSHIINGKSASEIKFAVDGHGLNYVSATSNLQGVVIDAPLEGLEESKTKPLKLKLYPDANKHDYTLNWSIGDIIKGIVALDGDAHKVHTKISIGDDGYLPNANNTYLTTVNVNLPVINIDKWILFTSSLLSSNNENINEVAITKKSSGSIRNKYKSLPINIKAHSPQFKLGSEVFGNGDINLVADNIQTNFNFNTPITSGSGNFVYESKIIDLNIDKYKIYKNLSNKNSHIPLKNISKSMALAHDVSKKTKSVLPNIKVKVSNLFFQDHNLGEVLADISQKGNNVYLENGNLINNDLEINFNAINYCFGCGIQHSYVELHADAKIKDFGNTVESLDFGRILTGGNGKANIILQWNGDFQDFNIFKIVGTIKGNLYSGKFTKIDPGLLGSIFSIINMQSLFEFSSGDVRDIFEKGFYFNYADINLELLTSKLEIKNLTIDGPTAVLKSFGIVDFANNSIKTDIAISPKVGFAIAVAAGVATLNPFVGLAVYGAELITDDAQNKLLTIRYYISGDLHKPNMERSEAKDNLFKNMNSTIGLDW